MARLNIERQQKLEPKRIEVVVIKITDLGIEITDITSNAIKFDFKGSQITFYPYAGWHTGKTIKDGRGIFELLKQLKNENK